MANYDLRYDRSEREKEYKALIAKKGIRCIKYEGWKVASSHKCLTCERTWETKPSFITRTGSGCRSCSHVGPESVRSIQAQAKYAVICKRKKVALAEPYKGMLIASLHTCLKCSCSWDVKPSDVCTSKAGYNRCPECKKDSLSKHQSDLFDRLCSNTDRSKGNFFERRRIKLGGKKFFVQGYEDAALRYLTKIKKVNPDRIEAGLSKHIPTIRYLYKGHWKRYYPDLYIKDLNRIVEVKSTYTLFKVKSTYYTNRRKAIRCSELGYDFCLLMPKISTRKTRTCTECYKIPKNWTELSWTKFKVAFNELNGLSS